MSDYQFDTKCIQSGYCPGKYYHKCGLYADIESNCRIYEHCGLEEARVNDVMPQRGIHILIGNHSAEHAYISEDCRCGDTLDNDEPQYLPRLGTYGLAYAELPRALLHGNEHYV